MDEKDEKYCRNCVYSEVIYLSTGTGYSYKICCMYLCVTGEMRKSKPGCGCIDKKIGKRIKRYADGTPRGRHVYYKNRVRVL